MSQLERIIGKNYLKRILSSYVKNSSISRQDQRNILSIFQDRCMGE